MDGLDILMVIGVALLAFGVGIVIFAISGAASHLRRGKFDPPWYRRW